MFCTMFTVALIGSGLAAFLYLVGKRLAAHARINPEAARAWFDHVIKPVLAPEKGESHEGSVEKTD